MKTTILFFLILFFLCPRPYTWSKDFQTDELITVSYGKSYVVEKVLGRGDFGTIYRVTEFLEPKSLEQIENQTAGKTLALKVIHNDFYSPNTFSEFHKKYKYLAPILEENPEFSRVHNHGFLQLNGKTIKNSAVIEMELLEGADLHSSPHALDWTPMLSEEQAQLVLNRLVAFVAFGIRAIQILSENRVVHSDLGPKNIILTSRGEFKLIDFDFVDVPGAETYSYDPAYSPPEVLSDQLVLGASDFYSLGMMVARFLTGTSPIISYKNSLPIDFELYAMADADEFDEDQSFFNRIQGSKNHHEAMIERLSKKFEERLQQITHPQIRSRYAELTRLSLQLTKYNPAERDFSWNGRRYSYRGVLSPEGSPTSSSSSSLTENKCEQNLK